MRSTQMLLDYCCEFFKRNVFSRTGDMIDHILIGS